MQNSVNKLSLPFLLIYSRLVLGIIIPFVLFTKTSNTPVIASILITAGLLTDVFDGIVARHRGISSERLRVWDSNVDQFFWLTIIGSVFVLNITYIRPQLFLIYIVLALEVLAYLISYIKFKKVIATHSILAKIWTISLLIWIIELILYQTNHTFQLCFLLGVLSRLEIILIILRIKEWATDVTSIFVVGKMNRGEKIEKSKWLNG